MCSWMSFQNINERLRVERNDLLSQIRISGWLINRIVPPTNIIAFTQPYSDIIPLAYMVRCFKKLLNKPTTSFIIGRFLSKSSTIFSVYSINGKFKFYLRLHKKVFSSEEWKWIFCGKNDFGNSNVSLFALVSRNINTNFFNLKIILLSLIYHTYPLCYCGFFILLIYYRHHKSAIVVLGCQ